MNERVLSDRAYMTPLLNRIADVAGLAAALKLGSEKAGEQIHIPKSMSPENDLAKLIGFEAAQKMSLAFGGGNLLIPAALSGNRRRIRSTIDDMIDNGHSDNEIVRATGVCRRTVTYRRAELKKDDGSPGPLFD